MATYIHPMNGDIPPRRIRLHLMVLRDSETFPFSLFEANHLEAVGDSKQIVLNFILSQNLCRYHTK
jgi:hypothetical protein